MAKGKRPDESPVPALQLQSRFGHRTRDLNIVVGEEYVVEPMNPQKQKHRGRPCVVTGFVQDDIGTAHKVKVQFLDNHRPGRVDLDDLTAPGLTKDRGVRGTIAPKPAGPAMAPGETDIPATLNVHGLEGDLEELFQMVTKQIKAAEGSAEPKTATELLLATVMMEGMGKVLGVLAHHIEEPEARQRLVHMVQRFGGYKGAARGATMATSSRLERAKPKH